jgi:hypothetical protein
MGLAHLDLLTLSKANDQNNSGPLASARDSQPSLLQKTDQNYRHRKQAGVQAFWSERALTDDIIRGKKVAHQRGKKPS